MKINLKILDASYVFAENEISDLNTKALVPKMIIRRRLTRTARIAVFLSSKIAYRNQRIVFGSSYGELIPTEHILNSINNKEPISPNQFQNSVYNTPVSYLSILSTNKNEIQTISCDDQTSMGVLKVGAVKSLDGDEIVLLVIESLNIQAIKDVNHCVDYLECGVILKVAHTEESANLETSSENNLKLPHSIVQLYNIAKCSKKGQKNIVAVNI